MLATSKPETSLAANKIIIALTINRNNPKVSMVIGKVKKTKTGLTINCKSAKTTATQIAVLKLSNLTPLNIFGNKYTPTAVSSILNIPIIVTKF